METRPGTWRRKGCGRAAKWSPSCPAPSATGPISGRITRFTATLADLQLEVSTGPIIDFRLPNDLRAQPGPGTAPLLYPVHVRDGQLAWPQDTRTPNAIRISTASAVAQ